MSWSIHSLSHTVDSSSLKIMKLTDWQLVQVSGEGALDYLQGQLTCDMHTLTSTQHILCGHCDPQGKVWSPLLIFTKSDDYAYLLRQSVIEKQVAALKKYAVFARVTIEPQPQWEVIGIVGQNARDILSHYFSTLPDASSPLIYDPDTQCSLLYFSQPMERFLLILPTSFATSLLQQLHDSVTYCDPQQWLAYDIAAGLPIIEESTSGQFIPQALNLHALGGISFTKGCYSGQETIARAKYRGANKRALYWLAGQAQNVPHVGDELELKLGENWRRTGTILAACHFADKTLWVQAVLNRDLPTDSQLRLRGDEGSQLSIQPLPYTLLET